VSSVVVFDYGSGNLHSVVKALESCGAKVQVSSSCDEALEADGLVVPGVGAFAACMDQLVQAGGVEIIQQRAQAGRAILGICVGHQVLFTEGIEHGISRAGVGIYSPKVEKIPAERLPHMGWNQVHADHRSRYFPASKRFYFVHSYGVLDSAGLPDSAVALWTDHGGVRILAAVEYGAILSTQFHPEKSGSSGLELLQAWVNSVEVV